MVTQRRHLDDTSLFTGKLGRHWLIRAQAFAGGPEQRTPSKEHEMTLVETEVSDGVMTITLCDEAKGATRSAASCSRSW